MRLYFIRDRLLKPHEDGAFQQRFLPTRDAATEVVRMAEPENRTNAEVLLIDMPVVQAEMAQVLTDILHGGGSMPLTIVLRSWIGTRRGGLQEVTDDAPAKSKRKAKEDAAPKAGALLAGTPEAQQAAADFFKSMGANS